MSTLELRPKSKPRLLANATARPGDVWALVIFPASEDARGMTGHEHFVDAGWR